MCPQLICIIGFGRLEALLQFFPSFENPFCLFVNCKTQIDISFLCVCSLVNDELRHNIVKLCCGSTVTML